MKGETDGVVAAVAGGRRRGREKNEEDEEEWREFRWLKKERGWRSRAGVDVDGGLLRRSCRSWRRAKQRESREGLVRGRRARGREREMKRKEGDDVYIYFRENYT